MEGLTCAAPPPTSTCTRVPPSWNCPTRPDKICTSLDMTWWWVTPHAQTTLYRNRPASPSGLLYTLATISTLRHVTPSLCHSIKWLHESWYARPQPTRMCEDPTTTRNSSSVVNLPFPIPSHTRPISRILLSTTKRTAASGICRIFQTPPLPLAKNGRPFLRHATRQTTPRFLWTTTLI